MIDPDSCHYVLSPECCYLSPWDHPMIGEPDYDQQCEEWIPFESEFGEIVGPHEYHARRLCGLANRSALVPDWGHRHRTGHSFKPRSTPARDRLTAQAAEEMN